MPAASDVADRAVFWAELGAVSAPALLGRLGRVIEEVAAKDPELSASVQVAAAHVRERCVVWHTVGTSVIPPASGVSHSKGLADAPLHGGSVVRSERGDCVDRLSSPSSNALLLEGGAQFDWADTADSSDTEAGVSSSGGLRGFMRILPGCCPLWCVKLLPGVGAYPFHVAWLVALCLAVPLVLAESYMTGFKNPLDLAGLSANVGPMLDCILALKLLLYIPLIVSCRSLVMGDHFDELLRTEVDSPSGREFKTFVYRSVGAFFVFTICGHFVDIWEHHFFGQNLYSHFSLTRNVICFTSFSIFLVAYKLSASMVDRLRDHIAEPEMTARFWEDATRKYIATCKNIDSLWLSTGFSTAISIVFASNLLFAACFGAIGFANLNDQGFVTTWRPWVWALKQLVIVFVGLLVIANINSRSSSTRHAGRSLLYVAREQCGLIPPECLMQHKEFIDTVQEIKCGVEFAILPVLTMAFIAPVVRVAFVCAPFVGGLAYSLAQRDKRASMS